ncbi:hypothetical protein ACFLRB_03115 [Acidobacteriota bacterium]
MMENNSIKNKKLPVTSHLVRVTWDGQKAKVYPPTLIVRTGDKVYFYAKGSDMSIIIPKDIKKTKPGSVKDVKMKFDEQFLKDGDSDMMITVKDKIEGRTDFPYAIYCEKANDFVEGNSPPEMIIEPELK